MPERAVRQRGSSMRQGILLPIVVHQRLLFVLHRLPIGFFTPQKVLRPLQQGGAHELLMAQGEREGNR